MYKRTFSQYPEKKICISENYHSLLYNCSRWGWMPSTMPQVFFCLLLPMVIHLPFKVSQPIISCDSHLPVRSKFVGSLRENLEGSLHINLIGRFEQDKNNNGINYCNLCSWNIHINRQPAFLYIAGGRWISDIRTWESWELQLRSECPSHGSGQQPRHLCTK